jgi:leucyl-tRNA synthetase
MDYQFSIIEQKWKQYWKTNNTYIVSNDSKKPKCYVLDMFPYPSGAGLHVGHPLGYIASDIFARYKRLCGYNVLHPMGFDSFGLPAEQYALETGQHPTKTTEENIERYKNQLDNIGFCFDWSREIRTSDASYYKWTQHIFSLLFDAWYNPFLDKAEPIQALIDLIIADGFTNISKMDWAQMNAKQQQDELMKHRLAYQAESYVNWCEALGTVLANDEVINGVSERGGHPVVKRLMTQWFLRITKYAERLLNSLDALQYPESLKEMQRNWIGKSVGAEVEFKIILPNENNDFADDIQFKKRKYASPNMVAIARSLRKEATLAEDILWQAVRDRQVDNYKIRRQHPIENYIVDFVCIETKLIIEVDGEYHNMPDQIKLDAQRTADLDFMGYSLIRFTNKQVEENLQQCILELKAKLVETKESNREFAQQISSLLPDESNREFAQQISSLLPNESSSEFAQQISSPLPNESSSEFAQQISSLLPQGEGLGMRVFTTRPDTIFGVSFLVLAPELDIINTITTPSQLEHITAYKKYVSSRSDIDRMSDKKVSGCFTGAYAAHPITGEPLPIWISEYVLAGYGTGAIMAVPAGDERDFKFAKHFDLPIPNIFENIDISHNACTDKNVLLANSDFLNGLSAKKAIEKAIEKLEELKSGEGKIIYKFRDAGFSRQRYWGEPFPVLHDENGIANLVQELPVLLPHVQTYSAGPNGKGPLANLTEWMHTAQGIRETDTMPGFAGSSWYYLRYADPKNELEFASKQATDYWNQVDVYVGGAEHAVGHLLYSRMWCKVLFDLEKIGFDEPFKKVINQGMISGSSRFVYRVKDSNHFVSAGLKDNYETTALHVDVNMCDNLELNTNQFKAWRADFANATFELEDGKYICGSSFEKMSKRYYNVVNPDDIIAKYGADTFRMYEMFLGPVELSKPWDTKGIEGVHRFLRKFWRLFYAEDGTMKAVSGVPAKEEIKTLHKHIKKITWDMEHFSFNTSIAQFMIVTNELSALQCSNKEILESVLITLAPYAPHISEELYHAIGNGTSVLDADFPICDESVLVENTFLYPIAINGKSRTEIEFALDAASDDVQTAVMQNEIVQKWLEGREVKKFIFVKGKMVNVVG